MAKPDREQLEPGSSWPVRLLLIGCGNMAGAMLSRWLDRGLPPYRVRVIRPSGQPVGEGIEVVTTLDEPVPPGTLVLLGCKPQQLAQVAAMKRDKIGANAMLVSILAGVSLARLREAFPHAGRIVRCMPNLPVRYGMGVSVLHGAADLSDEQRAMIDRLMHPLGLVEWLDDEALFDAATALSGCGPAFLYRFIDALAQSGAALGLDPAMAARMALTTVQGAAQNAAMAEAPPAALADAVASKGGMTREGLNVLDAPDGLQPLLMHTLRAAQERGLELARLAAATATS